LFVQALVDPALACRSASPSEPAGVRREVEYFFHRKLATAIKINLRMDFSS
jgi:hypothetical protein